MTGSGPVLAPIDHPGHLDRVRALLDTQAIDAAVVSDLADIRWLSGFTGSNAVLYLSDSQATLVTDGRYATQAPQQIEAAGIGGDVRVTNDPVAAVAELAGEARVAADADNLSWADSRKYAAALAGDLVPLETPIVRLRAVKDAGELDRIRHAAAIADGALAQTVELLDTGVTERQVALALEIAMRERGATSSAYETIVASGPNAALPHARPTDRTIEPGDLVIIDVGALFDGYRSDMTRTFVVGDPSRDQERQLEVVREAQQLGVDAVRAGVPAREIDTVCRSFIVGAGWGEAFTHGTGHGVGLHIHEQPAINSRSDAVLEAGMVVTVEPGVYLPGVGGVRWEDLVIVGDDGAETVTGSPKNPVVGG